MTIELSNIRQYCLIAVLACALPACSSDTAVKIASSLPSDADPAFRLTQIDLDTNNNGQADSIYTLLYDNVGLATTELIDNEADGTADEQLIYTYQNGQLQRADLDVGIDGSIDSVRRFQYSANALLQSELVDDGNDGVTNRRIDYTAVNQQISSASFDNNNDGEIENTVTYRYDASGRVDQTSTDTDADGIADVVITYYYDAVGRVIERTTDIGDDGGVDVVARYTHEPQVCDFRSNHQPLMHSCVQR